MGIAIKNTNYVLSGKKRLWWNIFVSCAAYIYKYRNIFTKQFHQFCISSSATVGLRQWTKPHHWSLSRPSPYTTYFCVMSIIVSLLICLLILI